MCPLKGCFGVRHTDPLDCVGHHKRPHQLFCAWSPTPNDGWDLITLLDRQSGERHVEEVDSAPGKATLCIFLTATPPLKHLKRLQGTVGPTGFSPPDVEFQSFSAAAA